MNILASTKLGTTPKGQIELVGLAVEQAELNTEEEPVIIEDEHVERYILCANQALPYFSVRIWIDYTSNVDKLNRKLMFMLISGANRINTIHQVCLWETIPVAHLEADWKQRYWSRPTTLRVLKVFAEMSAFCGTLDSPNLKIESILNVLQVWITS